MTNLLSVKQVAFILKVHPLTIRRYIKEKRLKAVKVGGNIRIEENALQDFHKEVTAPPPTESRIFRRNQTAAKQFTEDDPLFHLHARGASLTLS